MREVRVDLSIETIYQVNFCQDYITLVYTIKCDYEIKVTQDQNIMQEAEHK